MTQMFIMNKAINQELKFPARNPSEKQLYYNMQCILERNPTRDINLGIGKIGLDKITYSKIKLFFDDPPGYQEKHLEICPSCGERLQFIVTSERKFDRAKKMGLVILLVGVLSTILMPMFYGLYLVSLITIPLGIIKLLQGFFGRRVILDQDKYSNHKEEYDM